MTKTGRPLAAPTWRARLWLRVCVEAVAALGLFAAFVFAMEVL